MKYTTEETKELIDGYIGCKTQEERVAFIGDISVRFNKSEHSIRSKLVSEGVYVSNQRVSKITGGKPKSKEKMVMEIEDEFNFGINALEGLEKAPKLVLMKIYNKLKELQNN